MAFGKAQVMFDLEEGRASAGEAAVYVAENSAVTLAEAIERLLDDAAARQRMGEAGAKRLREELGWQQSVASLGAAYDALLR
jgi:glycosyltransferase involved in cell wall biosynthesis